MKRSYRLLATIGPLALICAVLFSFVGCTGMRPVEPFELTRSGGFISVSDVEAAILPGYSTNQAIRTTTAYVIYPVPVVFMACGYSLAIFYDVLSLPFALSYMAFNQEDESHDP